jgi:putative effector of murein hydrolase
MCYANGRKMQQGVVSAVFALPLCVVLFVLSLFLAAQRRAKTCMLNKRFVSMRTCRVVFTPLEASYLEVDSGGFVTCELLGSSDDRQ